MTFRKFTGICLTLLFAAVLFSAATVSAEEDAVVSFNKATVEQMVEQLINVEELDISEDLAKAIVEFREKNGPFKDPLEMRKVPGMTDYFYEEINPQLTDDGDVVFDPNAEPALAPSKC